MPDPTTPSVPVVVTADPAVIMASSDAMQLASEQLEKYQTIAQTSNEVLTVLNNKLAAIGVSMQDNQSLTQEQATKFGLLSVAIVGTTKSFQDLAGIDMKSLNTFRGQLEGMTALLGTGGTAINTLSNLAINSFGKAIPDSIMKGGLPAIKAFVMNLAESADNGIRLQNAYVQMAGKTGNLGKVFNAAGVDLGNMNSLLSKQQEILASAGAATGLLPDQIHRYYAELGSVPKALDGVVAGTVTGNQNISMLTATIKLATGTGRNYSEVIDDLHLAFKTYGTSGEEALKFTARMSEVSNKFGVELGDVRQSLRTTAETFKMFGNEAEGAANIMNSYLGALQSTGLSGASSIGVISSMTHAMSGLTIAQKSFLSAQTGGPGGLVGGFQIEKMMNEGKIDEVFEKVRQQMQKQFGKIVSVEEAANSPQAAAQLVKQRAILKQGPLGQFAKDDQTASKILEAFRAKDEGKISSTPLSESILKEQMDRGTQIEEQSYTELTKIRALLESQRGQADIINLGTAEQALAARAGIQNNDPMGDARAQSKDKLKQTMDMAATRSGRFAIDHERTLTSGSVTNTSGESIKTGLSNTIDMFKGFSTSIAETVVAAKRKILGSEPIPISRTVETAKLKSDIEERKVKDTQAQPKSIGSQVIGAVSKMAQTVFGTTEIPAGNVPAEGGMPVNTNPEKTVVQTPAITTNPKVTVVNKLPQMHQHGAERDKAKIISSAAQIKGAAIASANTPSTSKLPAEVDQQSPTSKIVTHAADNTISKKIEVEITGYCIKCKNEISGSRQSRSTSVGTSGE